MTYRTWNLTKKRKSLLEDEYGQLIQAIFVNDETLKEAQQVHIW